MTTYLWSLRGWTRTASLSAGSGCCTSSATPWTSAAPWSSPTLPSSCTWHWPARQSLTPINMSACGLCHKSSFVPWKVYLCWWTHSWVSKIMEICCCLSLFRSIFNDSCIHLWYDMILFDFAFCLELDDSSVVILVNIGKGNSLLTAQSHYVNQCGIISGVLWHSFEAKSTGSAEDISS